MAQAAQTFTLGGMDAALSKPDHLNDGTRAAIEEHRARFATAAGSVDRAWAIGSAKDLVESVARAVCDAKGVVIGRGEDFATTVNTAHVALERQPDLDVSMTPEIRAIAGQAKKMILNLRAIRNDVGTGHGRANIVQIDDEMIGVVCDATMLWVRWALRRLDHILIGEADLLLAELRGATVTRQSLERHLEAVVLPDQPPVTQRALGVAFAQRSAGWTFVTREVGIDPCVASEDLRTWSADYRLGVVEASSSAGGATLVSIRTGCRRLSACSCPSHHGSRVLAWLRSPRRSRSPSGRPSH